MTPIISQQNVFVKLLERIRELEDRVVFLEHEQTLKSNINTHKEYLS